MKTTLEIIVDFYHSFQKGNSTAMGACYHEEAIFRDPVFCQLNANQVRAMWAMLIERAGGQLTIRFHSIKTEGNTGSCQWEAIYPFGKSARKVHNKISAQFEFKDGKIYRHIDTFSFYRWARMALGLPGVLLGFTPLIRNKVKKKSLHLLDKYMQSQ